MFWIMVAQVAINLALAGVCNSLWVRLRSARMANTSLREELEEQREANRSRRDALFRQANSYWRENKASPAPKENP